MSCKEEELLVCPFDSSHRILRSKMNVHIERCRKNFPGTLFRCDFNAAHMIPEAELRYHHQTCPDRKKIENQIVESTPIDESRFPLPQTPNIEPQENWDTEVVPSYDPSKNLENRNVLRHLDVESGARRRNFRLNERLRLGNSSRENYNVIPVEPAEGTEKVALPPHRSVTNVTDDKYRPSSLAQKLKLDTNKVFVQNPAKEGS